MQSKNIRKNKKTPIIPLCKGHIWIDGSEGTFLAYGRIVLLERIREDGSITKAAKSMDMSYRHAWELVDSMNRQASRPLVISATGGKGGGGAQLTDAGEKSIVLFWKFYADFQDFLRSEEKILNVFKKRAEIEKIKQERIYG